MVRMINVCSDYDILSYHSSELIKRQAMLIYLSNLGTIACLSIESSIALSYSLLYYFVALVTREF